MPAFHQFYCHASPSSAAALPRPWPDATFLPRCVGVARAWQRRPHRLVHAGMRAGAASGGQRALA
ncbi:hypothetical protein BRN38_12705, partial [Xanthomonas oryzae pv. oryzae]